MPSFPDADLDRTVSIPSGPTAPEDVLRRVKHEGLRRRTRRHRRNAVLAALGLAIAAVPAISLLPGDDGREDVDVAAEADPSTTVDVSVPSGPSTTAVTIPPLVLGEPVPPEDLLPPPDQEDDQAPTPTTATPRTTPTTAARPPSTTIPPCRDSVDEACGEFRWDPAPGPNGALSLAFVDSPAIAQVGVPVTFNVVWSDPDATLTFDNFSAEGAGLAPSCTAERRFGPWTPPAPAGGDGELSYDHTFTAPGSYTVVVSAGTADCNNPYGSSATVELVVTVE